MKKGNPNIAEYGKATRFTSETAREAQPKGAAEKQRRLFGSRLVQQMMNAKLSDEEVAKKLKEAFGIEDETVSHEVNMHAAQIKLAEGGDSQAYKSVMEVAGYIKQKVETTQHIDIELPALSTERIKELRAEIDN